MTSITIISPKVYSAKTFAPLRFNIKGEHIDYPTFSSGGPHNFSLPAASHMGISVTVRSIGDPKIAATSEVFGNIYEFTDLGNLQRNTAQGYSWTNYLSGIISVAGSMGLPIPNGFELNISGDVPIGAGMSASAAFCVANIMAFDAMAGWNLDKLQIAKLAQAAEHSDFVGSHCGLLDQISSLFGQEGKAIFVDHGDYSRIVPVDLSKVLAQGFKFLLINSGVSRELGGTFYNDRVDELKVVGGVLASVDRYGRDHISSYEFDELNRLGVQGFISAAKQLGHRDPEENQRLWNRAMHVLMEKAETANIVDAFETGNVQAVCTYINRCGHRLSREGLFDISGTVIRDENGNVTKIRDYLDIVRDIVIGSYGDIWDQRMAAIRMMGGGGGGCSILLLPEFLDTPKWRSGLSAAYRDAQRNRGYDTDYDLSFIPVIPSQGARVVHVE